LLPGEGQNFAFLPSPTFLLKEIKLKNRQFYKKLENFLIKNLLVDILRWFGQTGIGHVTGIGYLMCLQVT
jgi:hypothetical protein